MEEARRAEVAALILATWNQMVGEDSDLLFSEDPELAERARTRFGKRFIVRLFGVKRLLPQHRGEEEEEEEEEEESVGDHKRETMLSPSELWQWLFTAPAPHACLSFLDDYGCEPGRSADQGDKADGGGEGGKSATAEAETDAAEEAIADMTFKALIFTQLAPRVYQGERGGEVPNVERMLMRRSYTRRMPDHLEPLSKGVADNLELALGYLVEHDEQSRESFFSAFRSMNVELVREAVYVAGGIMVPTEWQKELERLLRHADKLVRLHAIRPFINSFGKDIGEPETDNAYTEELLQVLMRVEQEEINPIVRQYMYSVLGFHQVSVKLCVVGLQDEDHGVRVAATKCLHEVLAEATDDSIIRHHLPLLLNVVPKNLMWATEPRSLQQLAAEAILSQQDKRDTIAVQQLPWLKRLLKKLARLSAYTSPHHSPIREVTVPLIHRLSKLSQSWCHELMPVIKAYFDRESWQSKECGIQLLGIMARYCDAQIWPYAPAVYEYMYHPEVKVRSTSCWALGCMLIAHGMKDEMGLALRLIGTLADRIDKHTPLRELVSALGVLEDVLYHATSHSTPELAMVSRKIWERCASLSGPYAMRNLVFTLMNTSEMIFEEEVPLPAEAAQSNGSDPSGDA